MSQLAHALRLVVVHFWRRPPDQRFSMANTTPPMPANTVPTTRLKTKTVLDRARVGPSWRRHRGRRGDDDRVQQRGEHTRNRAQIHEPRIAHDQDPQDRERTKLTMSSANADGIQPGPPTSVRCDTICAARSTMITRPPISNPHRSTLNEAACDVGVGDHRARGEAGRWEVGAGGGPVLDDRPPPGVGAIVGIIRRSEFCVPCSDTERVYRSRQGDGRPHAAAQGARL